MAFVSLSVFLPQRPSLMLISSTIFTSSFTALPSCVCSLSAMAIPVLSLLTSCTILVFAIYKYVVYPAVLSPLAKIPNAHFTSSISPAWILWTRFRARNNVTTYNAHQRYGPIVRLAPNEVSINCVDGGIRTVYAGGMEKPRWYRDQFASYG